MQLALLLGGLFLGANGACLPSSNSPECQHIFVDYTAYAMPISEVSWQWNCNPGTGAWQTISYRGVSDCSGVGDVTVGLTMPDVTDDSLSHPVSFVLDACGTPCVDHLDMTSINYMTTDCSGQLFASIRQVYPTGCHENDDASSYTSVVCDDFTTVRTSDYDSDQCTQSGQIGPDQTLRQGVCVLDEGGASSQMIATLECYDPSSQPSQAPVTSQPTVSPVPTLSPVFPATVCLPDTLDCQFMSTDFSAFGQPLEAVSWEWDCNSVTGAWQTTVYQTVSDCSGAGEVIVGVSMPDLDGGSSPLLSEMDTCGDPCVDYVDMSLGLWLSSDCSGDPVVAYRVAVPTGCTANDDGNYTSIVCDGFKAYVTTEYEYGDQCMAATSTDGMVQGYCQDSGGSSMMATNLNCYDSNYDHTTTTTTTSPTTTSTTTSPTQAPVSTTDEPTESPTPRPSRAPVTQHDPCLPSDAGCQFMDGFGSVVSWEWECDVSNEWRTTRYEGVDDCSGDGNVTAGVRDSDGEAVTFELNACGSVCDGYLTYEIKAWMGAGCTGDVAIETYQVLPTGCVNGTTNYCEGATTVITTEFSDAECSTLTDDEEEVIVEGVCIEDSGVSIMATHIGCNTRAPTEEPTTESPTYDPTFSYNSSESNTVRGSANILSVIPAIIMAVLVLMCT